MGFAASIIDLDGSEVSGQAAGFLAFARSLSEDMKSAAETVRGALGGGLSMGGLTKIYDVTSRALNEYEAAAGFVGSLSERLKNTIASPLTGAGIGGIG